MPSICSLITAVCSPRTRFWAWKYWKVWLEIKLVTNRLRGVRTTTTRAISQLTENMNASVQMMVSTPVNSWVKPISRPSLNVSTSAITRLTRSPEGWLSRYFRGSLWIFSMAALRSSLETLNTIRLLHRLISHCTRAEAAVSVMIQTAARTIPSKSTCAWPIIQSMALPVKTGTSSCVPTLMPAQNRLKMT